VGGLPRSGSQLWFAPRTPWAVSHNARGKLWPIRAYVRVLIVLMLIDACRQPISWILVDVAAAALLDMLHALPSTPAPVLHLIRPQPASWETVVGYVGILLALPGIPYYDWLPG
jgi:hypothetical protein